MNYYSIGEASERFGIPESTLRFYEKKGLLPLIERDEAGRRRFSDDQLALLKTVMCLKQTHMPIADIKQYVDWIMEGEGTLALRLDMMRRHKQAVLAELAVMNEALQGIDYKITNYTQRLHGKPSEGVDQQ